LTTQADKHTLGRNIVYVTFGVLVTNACLFVGNWAVIHGYGQGLHGQVVWILAASRLLTILADLGIASKAGVRLIARQRVLDPQGLGPVISRLAGIQVAVGAVLSAGMFALALPIASLKAGLDPAAAGEFVLGLRLAATWVLFQAGIRFCVMVSVGLERMASVLWTNPAGESLKVVWVFVCSALGLNLTWLFIGWTVAHVAALGVGLALLAPMEREFGFKARLRLGGARQALRMAAEAVPYFIPQLSMLGLPSVLAVGIGLRLAGAGNADAENSVFQVCWSLSLVSRLVSHTSSTALFPRFARLHAGASSRDDISATLHQASRLVGLSTSGLLALFVGWGGALLSVVYGGGHASALPLLLLLTLATGIENYTQQVDQVLMAVGLARVVMWSEALRVVAAAGVAWWLIPLHGAWGAGVGALAGTVGALAVKIAAMRRFDRPAGLAPFGAMVAVMGFLWGLSPFLNGPSAPCGRALTPFVALGVWALLALATRLLLPREIFRCLAVFAKTMAPWRGRRA